MHNRRARGLLASTVVPALVLAFLLALGVAPALATGPAWTDYGGNPIYNWGSSHRAYYPSVLYSATGFDGHGLEYPYKMFYDEGGDTWLAYSRDGEIWLTWGQMPVLAGDFRHPQVLYDDAAFGDSAGDLIQAASTETYTVDPYYKGWFWEAGNGSLIRFGYSEDGQMWYTNYPYDVCPPDEPGWLNPGSPVYDLEVMYDGGAYRGWADNNGRIYNVSSSDGTTWTLDTPNIAVDLGVTTPTLEWDSSSLSRVSVVKTAPSEWHLWYGGAGRYDWNAATGGGGNMGVGYASSTDGLTWSKDATGNPIASLGGFGTYSGIGNPAGWNGQRNYAMSVLYDPNLFGGNGTAATWKMWRSGRTFSGDYSIGLGMSGISTQTPTSLTCTVSDDVVIRGDQLTVFGRLFAGVGNSIGGPGRTVSVWAGTGETTPTGAPSFVATATYDAFSDVYWTNVTPADPYTTYELRWAGDADYLSTTSPGRLVEMLDPDVTVTKTVDFDGTPGYSKEETNVPGTATWKIVTTNSGDSELTTVTVTDTNGQSLGPWTLAPGASETVTYTSAVSATTTNTANASGYAENGNEYIDDSTAIAHVINPGISVDKTVDFDGTPDFSKEETNVPGTATWKIVTTNSGDSELTSVTVTDTNGQSLGPWTLAPGASQTVTYTSAVSATTTNTANASGYDSIGNEHTDDSTAIAHVINPGISVDKTVDFTRDGTFNKEETNVGGSATWKIVTTNTGDSTLTFVTVTDTNGKSYGPWTLAPGEIKTVTYKTTVTKTTVNTADADGYDESGNLYTDSSSATARVVIRTVERISGYDRYEVAANLAREAWPGFVGIRHVLLTAGEDRAAADPLTASGLSGVYDAPVLMVWGTNPAKKINSSTRWALQSIVNANPGQTIYVHVVGGPVSVPYWVPQEIAKISPRLNVKDRISGADRYALALNIADRMQRLLGPSYPKTAFVTNGENSAYFFNALAAAPSSAAKNYPVLLSRNTFMPYGSWAKQSYNSFYVMGSTPAVPSSIQSSLGAARIPGTTRFDVAYNMAHTAVAKGWLKNDTVAVANKLPDAITGGSGMGHLNGPILYTDASPLNSRTNTYLTTNKNDIRNCYVLGGPRSVHESTVTQIRNALR